MDIWQLKAATITGLRQYNRLHFAIVSPHERPGDVGEFFALLQQRYPSLRPLSLRRDGAAAPLLTPLTIVDEPLVVVSETACVAPLCLHYDIYWAVASLSAIRRFIDDLKHVASHCGLLCIRYPDELKRSFRESTSPLFDACEVCVKGVRMEHFRGLLEALLYDVIVVDDRFVGYTDTGLKDFVQFDVKEEVVRVCQGRSETMDTPIASLVRDAKAICECVSEMVASLK